MARPTKSQAAQFRALIARTEPAMQRAFAEAVAGMYASIDWRALLDALARQDIDGAIAAMGIDAGAFSDMYMVYQQAAIDGAKTTVATLGISGVTRADAIRIRFDMSNPRAENAIASASSRMIQQVTKDTQDAARDIILRGYQQGRGPRDIATDLVGRVVDGRRQGGVIGLDSGRMHRYTAVTEGMRTADGVHDLVIRHRDGTLGLRYVTTPDVKRRILAAYKRGEAVPAAGQRIIEERYRNALLKHRADTIAQVETAQGVMLGRREEWNQVLEKLGRSPDDIIKKWQHGSGGKEPRPSHVAMNGREVRGLDTPFVFNDGSRLQFAHDPRGRPEDVIRCTCDTTFRLAPNLDALR